MPTNIPSQTTPDITELSNEDGTPLPPIYKAEPETDQSAKLDEEFATIMQRHGRTLEALTNR